METIKKSPPVLSVAAFEGNEDGGIADYQNEEANDKNNNTDSSEPETFTAAYLFQLNASEIPCLVDPIIPQTGIWTIVGSSDTGKSMLFRQLALDIAKGKKFLGMNVNSRFQKVVFIATEDDAISTSFLLRKQSSSIDFLENIRFHFETTNIIEYLENELTNEPVDLVIVDAWSDVFGQNLNDSALIRQTLNKYRSLSNKYGCSIGFLHHTGKRTEKLEPSKNNILSGQGYEAKMRLVIELRNDLADENIKHLCIVKGNYLGKEYKQESIVLDFDPDTFRFSNTGRRIPFDQLSAPQEQTTAKKKNTPVHEIEESTHLELLPKVFKVNKKMLRSDVCDGLGNAYSKKLKETFGRDRKTSLLKHLVDENFILQTGIAGASKYEFNEGYLLHSQ